MLAMVEFINKAPVATIIALLITGLVAVVGGVVTIVNPEALSFDSYVQTLGVISAGNGLLAIGRGVRQIDKPVVTKPVSRKRQNK